MNRTMRWMLGAWVGAACGTAVAADLPLNKVVLFTSGVGYFERGAQVEGAAECDLSFRTEQISDLIKSLVLMDADGGRVTAVNYESREPVARALRSFSVDLADNPSLDKILNRLRGVPVKIQTGGQDIAGAVVGVEPRVQVVKEIEITDYFLTLFVDGAMRTYNLAQVQGIEVQDVKIRQDLTDALKVLAQSKDVSRKSVRIRFSGEGKRRVLMGYMLESPMWKTSYRLVLGGGDPLVQGWAHVENMTDEDWKNVRLSLVSGRPISFTMNLYDPLYVPRPEIQPEYYAAVRPQLYEGAMAELKADVELAQEPSARASGRMVRRKGLMANAPAPMAAMADAAEGAGFSGEQLGGMAVAAAESRQAGELFEYPIKDPVNLPRRQSAMLPIVNQAVKGEKLSIINSTADAKHPMNGVELENTSGQFLMQGPVTVFDQNVYAGDARMPDTQKGEKRLISYALDLASEFKVEQEGAPEEMLTLRIAHGSLWLKKKWRMESRYVIRNKRDQKRTYLVEHPLQPGWDLVEPAVKDPEKTATHYRFRQAVDAAKTGVLKVRTERIGEEQVLLSNIQSGQIEFFVRMRQIPPAVKAALEKLGAMQAELQSVVARRAQLEQRNGEITREQGRIRENMKTVERGSPSYSRWEKKLVDQEEELERNTNAIAQFRADELAKQRAIAEYLRGLNVD